MSNCGKIVVAVSDEADPASVDAVLWSLAYRSNPLDDVQLVPNRGGVQGAQYGPEKTDSTMLIDATRKRPMAPLALPTREHMEHARELWDRLGLHPLTVTSPWHGYHLGDWTGTAGEIRDAVPPRATGSFPARRRWRVSGAAASCRKRRFGRWKNRPSFPPPGGRCQEWQSQNPSFLPEMKFWHAVPGTSRLVVMDSGLARCATPRNDVRGKGCEGLPCPPI